MPKDIIENRMLQITAEYRLFIESDFIETAVAEFSQSIGLSGRALEVLENALTIYLLAILDHDQTVLFISRHCDLLPSDSEILWTALELVIPEQIKKNIEVLQKTQNVTVLQAEISAAEHDLASLQNVRTMSHDMEVAQGHPIMPAPVTETTYQSSQADILRPPVAAPTVNETPRWDTE